LKWNLGYLARVFVLTTFASGATVGCGQDRICTLIGCSDGVQVLIESSADAGTNALPAGDYLFSVEVEGVRHSATCHVGASPGDPAVDRCDSGDDVVWPSVDSTRRIELLVSGEPSELSLSVTRAGAPATSLTLTPTFHDFYPNGPQCDRTPCRWATIEVGI